MQEEVERGAGGSRVWVVKVCRPGDPHPNSWLTRGGGDFISDSLAPGGPSCTPPSALKANVRNKTRSFFLFCFVIYACLQCEEHVWEKVGFALFCYIYLEKLFTESEEATAARRLLRYHSAEDRATHCGFLSRVKLVCLAIYCLLIIYYSD